MAVSGSAIKAGKAFVELYADDSKLVRGLRSAEGRLKSWGASVTRIGASIFAAGAGIVGAITPAVAIFAAMGGSLDDMSQRTGVAVEQLSSLSYAAEQSGSSADDLEKGIRKMQQTLVEAANGSETAAAALAAVGVSVQELQGLSPDEQFRRIATGIAGIKDPARRAAVAMDLFGKSGADLVPLLSQGAAGIREMERRAKALGLVMSTEDAQAAAALSDAWDELMAVGKGLARAIGAALAPELTDLLNGFVMLSAGVVKFIDQNRGLVVAAIKMAAAIAAIGGTVAAVGIGLSIAGVVVGGFATAIAAIVPALAAIGAALSVVGTAAAAIVTPVGLLVAGIAAGAAALIYFSGVGGTTFGYIAELIGDMLNRFAEAWGGIVAAVMTGDLATAGKIAITGLQIEMLRGLQSIQQKFEEITEGFSASWRSMLRDLQVQTQRAKDIFSPVAVANANQNKLKQRFAAEDRARGQSSPSQLMQRGIDAGQSLLDGMIAKAKMEQKSLYETRPIPKMPGTPEFGENGTGGSSSKQYRQSSAGTFSAAAAARLGGRKSPEEETAKNTGKTVARLDKLLAKPGATFA
jgi:hypothetical protein